MWDKFDKYLTNTKSGMTYEKYLNICDQLGEEPDINKIPPSLDDFPESMQKAIIIYNMLGDRIQADIGYLGKDYSSLDVLIDIHNIDNKEIFMETIFRLDQQAIEKSREDLSRKRKELEAQSKRRP